MIDISIASIFQWGSSYCNLHQWFPRNRLQAQALGTIIRNAPVGLTNGFCVCWFSLIAGFGSDQLDKSMLPLILGHFPAGASAKQIIHYSQNILSGNYLIINLIIFSASIYFDYIN